jgi:hypothetical protein
MNKHVKIWAACGVFVLALFQLGPVMAYDEPDYQLVARTGSYEVRLYAPRLVAEVAYGRDRSGFQTLFNYISGANIAAKKLAMTVPVTESVKISMTAPVTEQQAGGQKVMQFFLPPEFTADTAPRPINPAVSIKVLPAQYFAVITYSGRASDGNFERHHQLLRHRLEGDGLTPLGAPIKATYNGPFTLPFNRRNEAMFALDWPQAQ